MTVQEALRRMRASVHDVAMEFPDTELLRFLNTGIADVAARYIAADSPDFVRTVVVRDGDGVPDGFVRTAGLFPVRIQEGRFFLTDPSDGVSVRCFCLPPAALLSDDRMPLRTEQMQELAVRSAVLLVLNEHEFDVTQDNALLQSLMQDAGAAAKVQG